MLTPADAAIVRRDQAVPGLALVLDDDALTSRLRTARPELGLVSARATYVRYKPGTSCLVAYRFDLGDREALAFAKAYRQGGRAKVAKAQGKGGAAVVTLGDLVTLARVGGDRDLPAAAALDQPQRHRRLLRRLLPEASECWGAVPRCLRYKPERRWVGMVEHEGEPVALVKAYRRDDLARAHAGLRFAGTISPAAPRLLGVSRRLAALASSWVPGETLSDLLARPGASVATLGVAGEALAALHAGPPSGLPVAMAEDDAVALTSAADHLCALSPHLVATVTALVASLGPRLAAGAPEASRPRHGDFSPDQVVLGRAGPALLDFDNAEFGDPAADLGQFVASLLAAGLTSDAGAGVPAASWPTDFLTGYESAGGMAGADRIADHTAAALVRLAVEPFRTRAPDWPAQTEALLEHASVLMARTAR
ncbi:MAG: aminoglycoside phosphotransferase family protein [Actinobacteria bacterium]|nr:aminoglycoside phosphotransferase family protein [Actinomycetota bacterium]